MIKVGDKVAPFNDMCNVGVVVELKPIKIRTWLVGGTSGNSFRVVVKHDRDDELKEYSIETLMRLE
jgi:hypothetical protein